MGAICLLAIGLGCSLFRCVEGFTQFRKGKQTAILAIQMLNNWNKAKKFFILIINVQSLWFFKFYLYLPRIFKNNIDVDNYFSFLIIPFWTLIGPGILYQKLIN